ncbi:MAG TPA: chromosome segregation protein SMC [Candidatus Acidoferrum sp.]|nr:chromosome segregation protein SMC [Candidatus Acidoferrum sp.]
MRLESVVLHGFKSFGHRTTVKVLPGITAIVGPNGCGKSNISDAVRWTLGEQSAKTLRGQKMEDLIFHGSASHKPVGLAEVELTFSNDGTLSVPWSEIAVGRRLYRTGESEYVLNGSESRLRDILDLFAGTGANPRAYSVMDQDKLNHVLTAKPHERRVFIEEAAGIARYKQQRNETQGKLDASRQNLLRVRDVMDEVKRQLGSLERQARRAQQYKALEVERRELALTLVAADYAVLKAEGDRLAREIGAAGDREGEIRARIAQLAARDAGQRQVILESDHRLADFRGSLQKVQSELERLLERREQMGIQLREAEDEGQRLTDEVQQTIERLGGIAEDRELTSTSLRDAERLVVERAVTVRELEASVEQHRAGLAGERDRAEALRLEQVRIAGERTDLMRSAGELRERELQLTRRRERLAAERSEAEAEGERLSAGRAAIEIARDQALVDLESLRRDREAAQIDLHRLEADLDQIERRIAEARLTLASKSSSLDALRQLERAREGYGAGVRAVFAEGASAPGVVGTVADLLEVPGELERAVEAVLGERLQWIVVERFEHARAAVAYLRSIDGGAATFVPLDHLPAGEPVPSDNGVRWIAGRVGARSAGLVPYLLGHVAVVEHLDEAEALWRKNGVVATYVTPAGEVLAPSGRLHGGGADDASATGAHSLLARKRQIRELEEDVAALETGIGTMQATAAAMATDLDALRGRLVALDRSIQARETARVAGDKDLEQAGREIERVERHAETVRIETGQVEAEYQNAIELLGRLEQRITAAREAEAGRESAMTALRAAIEAGQERETALVGELTTCRVDTASVSERVEALRRELSRLDEMEVDLGQRLRQAQTRAAQVGERRVWLSEERERTDVAAREVATERDRAEVETRQASEHHERLVAEARAVEHELRGVESDGRRLVESIHELELAATERRVRREELAQEAQRTYGSDETALLERHDPQRDFEPVRARLAELTDKLGSIGPVNLVADEEYRELDERLTFLRTQHDDLSASIKDLEKALRGMTRTAQERFLQAFQEINGRFAEIFERLFEGGRAELRLVEAEEGGDPLDTGVDLMAQPRGKRLQSATLLSGGERALTGLALLFAIFYFRPSPFCMLDEVDAPLDDANIHRFLRVLRELTTQTQFLVITHNRATMEAADVLYGVTMEEPGLSKLVSVNLAEAD